MEGGEELKDGWKGWMEEGRKGGREGCAGGGMRMMNWWREE